MLRYPGSDSFLPLTLAQDGASYDGGLQMLVKSQSVDFGFINREVILVGQIEAVSFLKETPGQTGHGACWPWRAQRFQGLQL